MGGVRRRPPCVLPVLLALVPLAAVERAMLERLGAALEADDRAALVVLDQLLAEQDDDEGARLGRAEIAAGLGRWRALEQHLGWDGRRPAGIRDGERLGRAWQLLAMARLAEGDWARARAATHQALALGGQGVRVDEALLLVAQASEVLGDDGLARRSAERLWRGWRSSPHRDAAGLFLARLLMRSDPQAARRHLVQMRVDADLGEGAYRQLILLTLEFLWQEWPQEALVALRHGLRRLPQDLEFRRWELLLWARLDPRRAQQLWQTVPAELAADPELQRRFAAPAAEAAPAPATSRLATAREALAAARFSAVPTALAGLERDDPEALALALEAGVAPESLVDAPVATTPAGALLLADYAWRAARHDLVRRCLQRVPPAASDWSAAVERATFLRARLADAEGDDETAARHWGLLRRRGTGLEGALAWALVARQGGDEAAQAWERVLELLPPEHALLSDAAFALARAWLRPLPPGSVAGDLGEAEAERLERLIDVLGDLAERLDDQRRAQALFFQLQALAQTGRLAQAEACLARLERSADSAERRARLAEIAERLALARRGRAASMGAEAP